MSRTGYFALLAAFFALLAAAGPAAAAGGCTSPQNGGNAASAAAAPDQAKSATLLFIPGPLRTPEPVMTASLENLPGFAVGLFSPTLGRYSPTQMMLDISQGARIASGTYKPVMPMPPALEVTGDRSQARYLDWAGLQKRAADVPGEIVPGLLGCAVGRAHHTTAWVSYAGAPTVTGIAAADQAGFINRTAFPEQSAQLVALKAAQRNNDFVVGTLPPGSTGFGIADALAAAAPQRMIVIAQAPPDPARTRLLSLAVRGLGGAGGVTSATTRRDGLVAATDIAPTILQRLGVAIPKDIQGQPLEGAKPLSSGQLIEMNDRLSLVAGRRGPLGRAVITLGGIVLILLLLAGRIIGRYDEMARFCQRLSGLAVLWLPLMLLFSAAIRPSRAHEIDVVIAGSLLLGYATDRLVRWPRALFVPVAFVLAGHALDFIFLSGRLTGESLLGSNPLYGARFFGVGNEMEAVLTVSAVMATGAFLCDRGTQRPARWFAGVGATLALFLGAGRLGADVGGVLFAAAAFGVAALYAARMKFTPLRVALLVLLPILALALIVGLDALTGGESHLSRTVVHAQSATDLLKVFQRKFQASYESARADKIWMLVIISLFFLVWGWIRRERLFSRLSIDGEDPEARRPYRAGMVGGVAGTVVGALVNDSGPAILIIGTIYLCMGLLYMRGRPISGTMDG